MKEHTRLRSKTRLACLLVSLAIIAGAVPGSFAQSGAQSDVPMNAPTTGDVVRLLEQSTFGPTNPLIAHVQSVGIQAFLNEQFSASPSSYPNLPAPPPRSGCTGLCLRDNYSMFPVQNAFFVNALNGQDQLRQRVALALSEILVISGDKINEASAMAFYQNILLRDAFGNFRQILNDIALNPAMGHYLDMVDNDKPDPVKGTVPNENFTRELMQLFSIGLFLLNQDGTPQLVNGQKVPTFSTPIIQGFARVFTGWTYAPLPGQPLKKHDPLNFLAPMAPVESNHDTTDTKQLLNGVVLPAGQTAEQDLAAALDNVFNHQNVGPFIGQQLIQHLVTSNPSAAYVSRVTAVFNNNGSGVRGDMKAVVSAILLDPEARGDVQTGVDYGHLREPVLYVMNTLRAFNGTTDGLGLAPLTKLMGQDLFNAPSVFNYFPPDFLVPSLDNPPGTILAPEFGIQTTASSFARANFVNTILFTGIPPNPNGGTTGTKVDLSAITALAGDPPAMVAALNTLLMHNTMSADMQNVVVNAVSSIAAGNNNLLRAQTGVYAVLTSSQYQIAR
jgi:uncharacterized protein (DUF1800 family)